MKPLLLLIAGPAGVGKTSVIRLLVSECSGFEYIRPYTTRSLREGEVDKIAVNDIAMDELIERAAFVVVNELYGFRYGTPKKEIEDCFAQGKIPVIDWPVDRIHLMRELYPGKVFAVYLRPPSDEVLLERLQSRDGTNERFEVARREVEALMAGTYDSEIDEMIVSESDALQHVCGVITEAALTRAHDGNEVVRS